MFKKKSTKDLVHPDGAEAAENPQGSVPSQKKRGEGKLSFRSVVRSRPFIGGVCVLAAFLLAFVATPILQLKIAETTSVVVLTQPVPAGTQLTAEMLSTREMGVLNLPIGALSTPLEAVGKFAAVAGVTGDILTPARLSDQLPGDDPVLADLPEGRLAVSATLGDLAQSVSGKLRAGDIIRLYAILNPSAGAESEALSALSVPELQYVEVLAVTNTNARDVRSEADRMGQEVTDSDRQIATVTLAVNERQAAVLAGLAHNATLHAALVVRGDTAAKQTALDAQELYFATSVTEDSMDGANMAITPDGAESQSPEESPAADNGADAADNAEGGGEA